MRRIWKGNIETPWGAIRLIGILRRFESWALQVYKPWISSCLDQCNQVFAFEERIRHKHVEGPSCDGYGSLESEEHDEDGRLESEKERQKYVLQCRGIETDEESAREDEGGEIDEDYENGEGEDDGKDEYEDDSEIEDEDEDDLGQYWGREISQTKVSEPKQRLPLTPVKTPNSPSHEVPVGSISSRTRARLNSSSPAARTSPNLVRHSDFSPLTPPNTRVEHRSPFERPHAPSGWKASLPVLPKHRRQNSDN
jgi:hypothetical protein